MRDAPLSDAGHRRLALWRRAVRTYIEMGRATKGKGLPTAGEMWEQFFLKQGEGGGGGIASTMAGAAADPGRAALSDEEWWDDMRRRFRKREVFEDEESSEDDEPMGGPLSPSAGPTDAGKCLKREPRGITSARPGARG